MTPFITITSDGQHSEIYANGQLVPCVKHFTITNNEEGIVAKIAIEKDYELDKNVIEAIQTLGFLEVFQESDEDESD